MLKDLYEQYPEPFRAGPNRFEFAVTFLSIRPYKFVQHDPRLGQINMWRVDMDTTGHEIVFNKHPVPAPACSPESNFFEDATLDAFR